MYREIAGTDEPVRAIPGVRDRRVRVTKVRLYFKKLRSFCPSAQYDQHQCHLLLKNYISYTVKSLYNPMFEVLGMDCIISKLCYKGKILQRNIRKWQWNGHFIVIFLIFLCKRMVLNNKKVLTFFSGSKVFPRSNCFFLWKSIQLVIYLWGIRIPWCLPWISAGITCYKGTALYLQCPNFQDSDYSL